MNRKMAGSTLLQYLSTEFNRFFEAACRNPVNVPVTLKIPQPVGIRKIEIVSRLLKSQSREVASGVNRVYVVAPRLKFEGVAEYDSIKAVKQAVSIPVIANGDNDFPTTKPNLYSRLYIADGVNDRLRGALGRPWVFSNHGGVGGTEFDRDRTKFRKKSAV